MNSISSEASIYLLIDVIAIDSIEVSEAANTSEAVYF